MERSELAHKSARAHPAARGRTGMQWHTRHADAVRGENGEPRLTVKTWGTACNTVGGVVDVELRRPIL